MLWQKLKREQKLIPGAKFGKQTIAGHIGGQNGSYIKVRRPDLGVLRMLRLCLGSAPAYSPSAQVYSPLTQVKAAVAYVHKRK